FRVPCTDTEAYVECLARLDRDRCLLESMSVEARRVIRQNFSESAMTRRYVDFVRARTPAAAVSWPESVEVKPFLGSPFGLVRTPGLRPLWRWLKRMQASLRARVIL